MSPDLASFGYMNIKIPFLKRWLAYKRPSLNPSPAWIWVYPVRLEADHQRVFMRGPIKEALSKPVQIEIINQLNALFKEDHLEISCLTDSEWRLTLHEGAPPLANLTSLSPLKCLHQDIKGLLPQGLHQEYWRRLFTECQMVMAPYENNSLWFWKE